MERPNALDIQKLQRVTEYETTFSSESFMDKKKKKQSTWIVLEIQWENTIWRIEPDELRKKFKSQDITTLEKAQDFIVFWLGKKLMRQTLKEQYARNRVFFFDVHRRGLPVSAMQSIQEYQHILVYDLDAGHESSPYLIVPDHSTSYSSSRHHQRHHKNHHSKSHTDSEKKRESEAVYENESGAHKVKRNSDEIMTQSAKLQKEEEEKEKKHVVKPKRLDVIPKGKREHRKSG